MVTTLLAGGLLARCGGEPGDPPDTPRGDELTFEDGTAVLACHQFSTSPSLAWVQGSSDPLDPDYGALSFFVAAVPERIGALDGDRRVLELADWPATAAQVAAGEEVAATHVSGGSLNPAWGFLVNSIPFGPDFGEMPAFPTTVGGWSW